MVLLFLGAFNLLILFRYLKLTYQPFNNSKTNFWHNFLHIVGISMNNHQLNCAYYCSISGSYQSKLYFNLWIVSSYSMNAGCSIDFEFAFNSYLLLKFSFLNRKNLPVVGNSFINSTFLHHTDMEIHSYKVTDTEIS